MLSTVIVFRVVGRGYSAFVVAFQGDGALDRALNLAIQASEP